MQNRLRKEHVTAPTEKRQPAPGKAQNLAVSLRRVPGGGFAGSPDVPAAGWRGSSTVCTQAIERSVKHPG